MTFDISRLAASTGALNALGSYDAAGATPSAAETAGIPQLPESDEISDAFGLGKDDFFKLFLAQLQNQDPTQPVDDKEFIAQLAQFTLIDTMQQVKSALAGTQMAQASSLIGQHVEGIGVDGQPLSGTVDRLVQQDGQLYLLIGDRAMKPEGVTLVTSDEPADEPATAPATPPASPPASTDQGA